jgi:hypothetical protein
MTPKDILRAQQEIERIKAKMGLPATPRLPVVLRQPPPLPRRPAAPAVSPRQVTRRLRLLLLVALVVWGGLLYTCYHSRVTLQTLLEDEPLLITLPEGSNR